MSGRVEGGVGGWRVGGFAGEQAGRREAECCHTKTRARNRTEVQRSINRDIIPVKFVFSLSAADANSSDAATNAPYGQGLWSILFSTHPNEISS